MGTEIAVSFTALRAQLENERSSLYKIDENIKKIVQTTGRFPTDRFNSSGDYNRGGARLGRNPYPEGIGNYKNDDLFGKRKNETKTVFSRLSGRANDSDGEEEDCPSTKKARVPSAVCRELPTRAAVLRAQGDDEQARKRNRRIFGSLLGTLQKFKQEEIVLQTKEDKKAQVERKIEEQARLEKEREQKERKTLFAERENKKTKIKALEAKMNRVQEFERWEESQRHLGNFILTKTKPHMYWLPKKMTDKTHEKVASSRKYHEKYMSRKREELQDELQRIEHRCLRPRTPGTNENDPDTPLDEDELPKQLQPHKEPNHTEVEVKAGDRGRKRDKFAMDVDEKDKEDSDGDERHEDASQGREIKTEEKVCTSSEIQLTSMPTSDESKMDTSAENNTTQETIDTTEKTMDGKEGKESMDGEGKQSMDREGKKSLDGEGKEPMNGEGKESMDGEGKEPMDGEGIEPMDGEVKETIDGGGKESIDGGGKESIDGGCKESIDGGGKESMDGEGKESMDGEGKESLDTNTVLETINNEDTAEKTSEPSKPLEHS